jgi:hypothetical protein
MPRRYALLVLVGAGVELRQGGAFGLALDRIDTAAAMITVDQQAKSRSPPPWICTVT